MMTYFTDEYMSLALNEIVIETIPFKRGNVHEGAPLSITVMSLLTTQQFNGDVRLTQNKIPVLLSLFYGVMRWQRSAKQGRSCCVHNASTVPWTSAGQFGRPRGVRGRPWYDLRRPRCVISHHMDVRGLPPGRPPSGRPRDTQFGIDWSLLPSGCPQGVRTAEVRPITARTHYGQEVGLPTVRPKPEVDVP